MNIWYNLIHVCNTTYHVYNTIQTYIIQPMHVCNTTLIHVYTIQLLLYVIYNTYACISNLIQLIHEHNINIFQYMDIMHA